MMVPSPKADDPNRASPVAESEKTAVTTAELFFSTTDRHGVIEQGNSTFVRISGYSQAELVGSPHNIVRHPDMPGGAFRLAWDRLTAGRPVGVYVRNQAKDGSAYWVFATMSPLRDGYLSVRMFPRGALFDVAEQLYTRAFEAEHRARRDGATRRDAARAGQAHIETSLRHLGFGSYDDFMLDALPAEISARDRLTSTTYARTGLRGPMADLVAVVAQVDEMLDRLVGRLAEYQDFCDRLATTAAEVLDIADRLRRSVADAQDASQVIADTAPALTNLANVMTIPMQRAVLALRSLRPALERLRGDVRELRFRISLAALHNTMVAAFAAEVIDGAAPPDSLHAVPVLCDAATSGLVEMATQVRRVNEELRHVTALAEESCGLLDEFRRFLGQWRNLVYRRRAAPPIRDRLESITADISASWDWMDMLHTLGRDYRSAAVSLDTDLLRAHLNRIKFASVALVGPGSTPDQAPPARPLTA